MGVVVARLVFLAFVGLTGFITYNALYLQDVRNVAVLPTIVPRVTPATPRGVATKPPEPPKVPAVSTDLPALQGQQGPEQLVTAIQRELAARGYSGGPADGKLRDETRRAITSFEKDNGLPITGSPSDELLRHILLGEAAATGVSTGSLATGGGGASAKPSLPAPADPTVKQVQQILADLGYAPGPIDGAMGSGTERAVGAFQRDRKIASTGRITPDLLREIKRVTGRDLANGASRP